jgi:hypothetical protein
MAGGDVGGEFVMAAAEVLDEGVPGGDDPRGPAAFQAAHRPEPGFQPPVVGLDRIIGVALNGMQRGGYQLIEDPRVSRGPVSDDLGRDRADAQRGNRNPAKTEDEPDKVTRQVSRPHDRSTQQRLPTLTRSAENLS